MSYIQSVPAFGYMFEVVRDTIASRFDEINTQDAATMLMDIEETHGKDAIVAMFGFLRYMSDKMLTSDDRRKVRHQVIATLAHDLNGRKDKFCLLRTSSYSEFITL